MTHDEATDALLSLVREAQGGSIGHEELADEIDFTLTQYVLRLVRPWRLNVVITQTNGETCVPLSKLLTELGYEKNAFPTPIPQFFEDVDGDLWVQERDGTVSLLEEVMDSYVTTRLYRHIHPDDAESLQLTPRGASVFFHFE